MFCSRCGKQTSSSGHFCQWCGADLTVIPPSPLLRTKAPGIGTGEYAGFWSRLLAFVVDFIFLLVIDIFVLSFAGLSEGIRMMYQYIRHMPMTDRYGNPPTNVVPMPILLSVLVLFILIPWLYFAGLEATKNQATPGKIAARVAVTDYHGKRISFSRATLRHFAKFVSLILLFAGFIMIGFTARKQGLHDKIAGTFVFRQV